jgi:dTDP-glucose 4,6-dehydratase/UDP-glucuronate decarboxylase
LDGIIEQDCLEYLPKIDFSPARGKSVLVTGANGLIGTYLIYFLHLANIKQDAGIHIAAVSKHAPCEKLRDIFQNHYDFMCADLAGETKMDFPWKTDYIVHAATYAQPEIFMKNYSETMHLNISATEALLKKAQKDHADFLFLSSSEVYGNPDPEHIPTREDYPGLCSPLSIRSIYSESKRVGETLCCAYRKFASVHAKIARISMSYGPGLTIRDKRVMGQFINQALTCGKIAMLDDGEKVRTFCYIADCATMLLDILLHGRDFVYNVGGGDRVTIRQLAEQICALTGSSLSVGPASSGQKGVLVSPQAVELDTTKVRSEFSLPPFKPLGEGLARTIAWNRVFL